MSPTLPTLFPRALRPVFGWAAILTGLATFAAPAHATGLIINATFGTSITSDPNAALIESTIDTAISFYEMNITTPITVSIDYQEMNTGLGMSNTSTGNIQYSQFLTALQNNSSGDATDTSALASLACPVPPGGCSTTNNPVNGTTGMAVATANLRALGFTGAPGIFVGGQFYDSEVSINTALTFDNTTGYLGSGCSGNSGNCYSLLAVVEHEMDEALGTGSRLNDGSTSTSGNVSPEDLFRFTSPGVRSYTNSAGATSYFSVDGGVTDIAGFNQGGNGSADYGDWDSSVLRVQNAYGTTGGIVSLNLESPETQVLDAIGYNFIDLPEPATFWMVGLGGIALGLLRRGRAVK
jgi:hypothetical protein